MLATILIFTCIVGRHATGAVCSTPSESRTRVFDTIENYRRNSLPFSPVHNGWEGSNVEFSFPRLDTISSEFFITHDSGAIISMKLSGKKIREVDSYGFNSLVCLHHLLLDHNNITELTKEVFEDLNSLLELDLSYNHLEVIGNFVFENLPKLRNLSLSYNRIRTVESGGFANLTSLECLNLEGNLLHEVDLHYLVTLYNLDLSWNRLLNFGKWDSLHKLQVLELAGNRLRRFDSNVSLTSLRSLNLSFNSLTTLDVVGVRRHYPQLQILDLSNNPWPCDSLESIVHELKDSRIQLVSGNYTTVGVHGIACKESPDFYPTTTTTTSTTPTVNYVFWVTRDELEKYVAKKIRENNEELKSVIESVRVFVIVVFCLVCLFVIFEIIIRTNVISRFRRRRSQIVVDDRDDDAENFRLLHSHSHSM